MPRVNFTMDVTLANGSVVKFYSDRNFKVENQEETQKLFQSVSESVSDRGNIRLGFQLKGGDR